MTAPKASVIVPTRNRADVLRRCLQSLTSQRTQADSFEVIVVDNGSTDETAAVANAFDGPLQLRLLHVHEPGLHCGRHAGWRAARADVLMFADDDIEAEPGWVEAVVARFAADPSVALVGGNNLPLFEHEPPMWLQRWWQQPVGRGRALGYLSILDFGAGCFALDPSYVWGCNFNVRRTVLEAARGFHPDGVPAERIRWRGDGESHIARLVRERGWRTLFDSAASVRHAVTARRMTSDYFEERAYAQGVSDSYTRIRRAGRAVLPWRQQARAAVRRLVTPLRERGLTRSAPADAATAQWRTVLRAVRRAYLRGMAYHQAEVARDPELLAWVLKEDYLT
ncbi:MAG: hypothetical protein CFE40_13245 [Burkholderiales bacterium PBB1]|nr:MAG: hypothetical protein CFE40_13245 [Burkholderiales bacterium PBB1]